MNSVSVKHFMGEIEVQEYVVEWDDRKNEINKKKQGISFETVAEIFLDDYRFDDYVEDRIKTVGIKLSSLLKYGKFFDKITEKYFTGGFYHERKIF